MAEIGSFGDCIEELTAVVERCQSNEERVREAFRVVERTLENAASFDLSRFVPGTSSYARHLIHCDPENRFCLLALVWKPGQGTPIHNHGATWGVYGVIEGSIRFINYVVDNEGSTERLTPVQSTLAQAGSATTVLPPHCDIHRMENPSGDAVSMTLHCYGKELKSFDIFQPESGTRREGSVTYDSVPAASGA